MIINCIASFLIFTYVFYISKAYYLKCNKEQKVVLFFLFFVHFTAMGLAYSDDIIDANVFYETAQTAQSWFSAFGLGSQFMAFLIYPLVAIGMSKFVLYFLFSAISFQAFLWYFQQMGGVFSMSPKVMGFPIPQLFFLLPSLHYWSGFVGKDALVFFFLTYLFFEVKKEKSFNVLHFVVLIIFLLLRPHVFAMTFMAFFIYFGFHKNTPSVVKIKLLVLSLFILGVFIPILLSFFKIESFSYTVFVQLWKDLNLYSNTISNGIALNETSFLSRIGLLLFSPLFYDATTFYQYIISIENSLVLLFLLTVGIYLFVKRKNIYVADDVKLALLTGFSIMFMIASYIYNLGLASRMRLMFLPLFFYAIQQLVLSSDIKKKK